MSEPGANHFGMTQSQPNLAYVWLPSLQNWHRTTHRPFSPDTPTDVGPNSRPGPGQPQLAPTTHSHLAPKNSSPKKTPGALEPWSAAGAPHPPPVPTGVHHYPGPKCAWPGLWGSLRTDQGSRPNCSQPGIWGSLLAVEVRSGPIAHGQGVKNPQPRLRGSSWAGSVCQEFLPGPVQSKVGGGIR